MAMQRAAGNSAVNALMAGRMRFPASRRSPISTRGCGSAPDEPAVDVVEKGLKAAKGLGVPVIWKASGRRLRRLR